MEKCFIPGTKPKWKRELPDSNYNSLVDKNGKNYENGYNFDEKVDDDEISFSDLEKTTNFDPEEAKKAREEVLKQQNSNK